MIKIKSEKEIETLREGGKIHSLILKEVSSLVLAGVSTLDLENKARELVSFYGAKGAFLGYKPAGAKRPYPAVLCVSLNNEIVHGIPNEDPKILKNGDVVSLDLGLTYGGLITDGAVTLPVGETDIKVLKMLEHCKEALNLGIKEAKVGNFVGDIGFAISEIAKRFGYGVCEGLAGHGVGYSVHEDPYVPNFGTRGEGQKLLEGMVIAIEPMFTLGSSKIVLCEDGYTYKTKDGSISCHFEHTVAITKKGPIILTK